MTRPTVKQFRSLCKKHGDLQLGFKPVDCGSWRGIYAEPCIFVEDGQAKLSDFLPFLDQLISGEIFYGYKGGDYTYNGSEPMNMELYSSAYSGDEAMTAEVLASIKTPKAPAKLVEMLMKAAE